MQPTNPGPSSEATSEGSRFVRACLRLPVDRTPVWFLRQAGRYMPEYMAVRKHHSLLDICRTPEIAAEVTITAAERLGVDAAIIFADLLLPLTPMGLDFEFVANEGPQVHAPIRTAAQAKALRTDRTQDLLYVARAIEKVAAHSAAKGAPFSSPAGTNALKGTPLPSKGAGGPGLRPLVSPEGISSAQDQLGIIGFCGAPFTLASYMIEGGSPRNYIETKKMMYASTSSLTQQSCHPERSAAESKDLRSPATDSAPESTAWPIVMSKLVTVLTDYARSEE